MVVPVPNYTPYDPPAGTDPVFDAWKATYTARIANAAADAAFQHAKLQDEYTRGLAELDIKAPEARQATEYALLTRGIGRGGEARRRRVDTEAGLTTQRTDADRIALEGHETIDQALARQYADWAAEWEGQVGASRERLLNRADKPAVPGYTPPSSNKGSSGSSSSSGSKGSSGSTGSNKNRGLGGSGGGSRGGGVDYGYTPPPKKKVSPPLYVPPGSKKVARY